MFLPLPPLKNGFISFDLRDFSPHPDLVTLPGEHGPIVVLVPEVDHHLLELAFFPWIILTKQLRNRFFWFLSYICHSAVLGLTKLIEKILAGRLMKIQFCV